MVRYRQIDTYGVGGASLRFVEATAQAGICSFQGEGADAEGAKASLCRDIEAHIGHLQQTLAAIRQEEPGAVETE